jgi:integrase
MMFDYAMQNDIVNKNYAEFINLPKSEKEEKEIFSDLDIQKLEKNDNNEWVKTILILIYTGLRINEMLSLTKFSVDMDNHTLVGGLKTEAGKNRTVPIHPKILKHIQYWLNKNGEYLICDDKGKRISDKKYREDFYYPSLDELKIKQLNPHCCRHTCASLLHKAGADPKYIQAILGHKKYSFTADTYTHTNVEELKTAINKI